MNIPQTYRELLEQFITFRTISTDPNSKADVQACITWLDKLFKKHGLETKILSGKNANPIVFAQHFINKKYQTFLIYGHYDVQPATRSDGWNSEPFKLSEHDDRYWGRGVIDNKGQLLLHLVTIFKLIKSGKLKYNVKFLIEGNEETGSAELAGILKQNLELLRTDHILISDGTLVGTSPVSPVIEVGFRGSANLTLKYTTAKNNVHSGIYGNTIPNAAHELCKFLSLLFDDEDQVLIPNFTNGIDPKVKIKPYPQDNSAKIKDQLGIQKFFLLNGLEFHSRTGLHPALIITGLSTGYTGSGYSNIIPKEAEVKINFRFAPGQDPEFILEQFRQFIARHTPIFVTYKLSEDFSCKGILLDYDQPLFVTIKNILEKVYGQEVVYKYVGGSLPIINDFK